MAVEENRLGLLSPTIEYVWADEGITESLKAANRLTDELEVSTVVLSGMAIAVGGLPR